MMIDLLLTVLSFPASLTIIVLSSRLSQHSYKFDVVGTNFAFFFRLFVWLFLDIVIFGLSSKEFHRNIRSVTMTSQPRPANQDQPAMTSQPRPAHFPEMLSVNRSCYEAWSHRLTWKILRISTRNTLTSFSCLFLGYPQKSTIITKYYHHHLYCHSSVPVTTTLNMDT